MTEIKVSVQGPYPCWVDITVNDVHIRMRHSDITAWEAALAEAKRQSMERLGKDRWHEIGVNHG